MKKFALLFILVVCRTLIYAQLPIQTFVDTEPKPPTVIYAKFKTDSCLYIGGQTLGEGGETSPYITKIDSNGKVVWRWTPTTINEGSVLAIMACDSSVYALTPDQLSSYSMLYKLKSSDGSVEWSTIFSYQLVSSILLHNYTDSTVAVVNKSRFFLFSKSTGVLLENLFLTNSLAGTSTNHAIDPYGYIYCGEVDTIYKFDNLNHDSLLWKQSYDNFPTWMDVPRKLYADSANLFVIGDGTGSTAGQRFIKIDPASGNVVYTTNLILDNLNVKELLDKDGFIYGALNHAFFGSVTTYNTYFKLEKQTGALAWYRIEDIDTLPNIPFPWSVASNDKHISLISIDVDSKGDLYGTGSYVRDYIGTCFIFKASGNDGSKLWQHTLIDDSSRYDSEGGGKVAWLYNDHAFFVGTLKSNLYVKDDRQVITAIVEADTSTGVIINKVYDGGSLKLPSKVIDLKYLPNGNIISFVQLGRGIQVLCTDSLLNLVWEKRFYTLSSSYNYVLKADKIAVGNNGDIAFCSTLHLYPDYLSNSQNPDSILYFRLDSSGNLLSRSAWEFSLQTSGTPAFVLDLAYDGIHGIIYCVDNNILRFLQYNNGNLQYNINVSPYNMFSVPTSIGTDLNSQFALYTRIASSKLQLVMYDKTVGTSYNLDTIPSISQRSIVCKINANRIFISGLSQTGLDTRVIMYDWVLGDTIWTSDLSWSFQPHIHVVYDSSTNAVYAVRRESQNKLSFERFNATTGQLIWTTAFEDTLPVFCNDLDYDTFNHRLIGVGSVANGNNDYSAVIWTFDSSGVAIDTIVNLNAPPVQRVAADDLQRVNVALTYNQSEATAALVINNQRVLVGASISSPSACNGAYFDLSPSGIVSAISAPVDPSKNILVFPNPFKSGVNVQLLNEGVHTLTLYDVQGRYLQSSVVDSPSQEMYYLDLSTLQSGYYILQVTDKKQQYNFRIVKQ